ncbi:MAG: ATP-binding protein [Magnetospirillum sp.]|nr:ATP-binding protein [Magnetospirillum sp.]
MMRNFLGRSISRKILASFVGIYAATYLLTALVVFTGVRASIIDAETKALSELADRKIERLASALRQNAVNLRAWSELDVMNDLITGDIDKRIARALEALKRQYGLEGDIYAFDGSGKLIASSSSGPLASAPNGMPLVWTTPGAGPVFIDKHINPLGQGETVAFTMPVVASFSRNYRIGSLVLTYPWRSIETLLFEGGSRILLLRTGASPQVLATDVPAEDALSANSAGGGRPIFGGGAYVAGRSHSVDPIVRDWQVVTLRQTEDAVRSVRRVAMELLLLGLFLGIPVLIGVRWLSQKLTKPVVELTGYVRGVVDTGNLGDRVPISSRDELGTLAQSFNRMTETLERAAQERERFVHELESLNQTLEAKVLARTRELETANGDLTKAFDDLKAAQAQLVQSEKMASLGQLVAGVAHELNNPIAFIYANFSHLDEYVGELLGLIEAMRRVPADPDVARRFEDLVVAADLGFVREDILKIIRSGRDGAARVKEIVLSLRSFSRLDEAEFKYALLEDGLNDALAILHPHMKGRIAVVKDFHLNQPVPCFPGQINQVFMNIVFNAIQAMEGEGTIRIATLSDDPWAVVVIEDSGKGIPPEIIDKIFDPFFTTKKVGEGTGLGLSISYGIMEKHGGRIAVRSEVGKGTIFELRLPLRSQMPVLGEA